MTQAEMNKRMPFMTFNWAEHSARTARLTWEERGMFDAARCILWGVVGCRMALETLKLHLRITPGSTEDAILETLATLGLLRRDGDLVYDEVQVFEFDRAVAQGKQNRENGLKGGRPRKQPEPTHALSPSPSRAEGPGSTEDAHDF
jgi:hypothetical protein